MSSTSTHVINFHEVYKSIRNNDFNHPIINFHASPHQILSKSLGLYGLLPPEKWNILINQSLPGLFLFKKHIFKSGCLEKYPYIDNNANYFEKSLKHKWITLGYHHNWDTKIYSKLNFSPIPEEIEILYTYILEVLKLGSYKAEAVIINYYTKKSFIKGHIDKSETNLNAPLMSISFGLTAIFLIQLSLDEYPKALHVKDGDIIIMSGQSRLAMHAVPKIIADENLSDIRINISIRQVF